MSPQIATLETPRAIKEFFSNSVHISIFGKPHNWSLKDINSPDSIQFQAHLAHIAQQCDVRDIYAPNSSTFNALLCDPRELYLHIALTPEKDIMLHRGAFADGVVIPKGAAMFIASADCPTLIVHDKETDVLIAAHAGLGCLVDRSAMIHNKPERHHQSIIDVIMRYVSGFEKKIDVQVVGGIKPKHFVYSTNHPVYGEANRLLLEGISDKYGPDIIQGGMETGCISLTALIESQFNKYDASRFNIKHDGVDTYGNINETGEPKWWSHVRYAEGKQEVDGRNGVFIVHK